MPGPQCIWTTLIKGYSFSLVRPRYGPDTPHYLVHGENLDQTHNAGCPHPQVRGAESRGKKPGPVSQQVCQFNGQCRPRRLLAAVMSGICSWGPSPPPPIIYESPASTSPRPTVPLRRPTASALCPMLGSTHVSAPLAGLQGRSGWLWGCPTVSVETGCCPDRTDAPATGAANWCGKWTRGQVWGPISCETSVSQAMTPNHWGNMVVGFCGRRSTCVVHETQGRE